ncbi:MAG TPA: hypothetical protein VFA47_13435 [Candidatus Manganitrophaceae bacterium]|nr:hypothetical protein [Candidatus Manganitrophaceae bacterium]
MKKRFKGALHLHTTFSDGEYTPEELKDHFQKRGFQFLMMSDHAEALDPEKMTEYVARCRALSDESFCMAPGLEFAYADPMGPGSGSLHLLGYGVDRYEREENPLDMVHTIHRLGGLAVLAHPYPPHYPVIAPMEKFLDGIELWNTKYNGRFAPALWNYALLKETRGVHPEVLGFYGTDFHWKTQYCEMGIWVEAESLTPSALLTALSGGKFYAERKGTVFTPEGALTPDQEARFGKVEQAYQLWKKIVKGGKQPFRMLHLPVPKRLKAMARKVL